MDIKKKLNFRQKKYILPAIALPFILFGGYQVTNISAKTRKQEPIVQNNLSTSLGDVQDSLLDKNAAYEQYMQKADGKTMLGGLEKVQDSLRSYSDNYDIRQKRMMDSLQAIENANQIRQQAQKKAKQASYYNENNTAAKPNDYNRQAEILHLLDNQASSQPTTTQQQTYPQEEEEENPLQTMRKQMFLLDSLEKARNPEYQSKLAAEQQLKRNKEKWNAFLSSTLIAKKSGLNSRFNTIAKPEDNSSIKAVIDQNIKGYLGSRIRFRLLEDIDVGETQIPRGTLLYAQITGFTNQRVNLNVVSIIHNGTVLPVNLAVYDTDGMKGLYVPNSAFREMMQQMGQTTVQGQNIQMANEGFISSMLSSVFSSTSNSIANLIRKNKAKLKYNTQIYLINEKEIQNDNY